MTWEQFLSETPERSIALDGVVSGGPRWDESTLHANFDHHDGVVREATMSTAMQVLFAIKGGLMVRMNGAYNVYVNDPDQDTSFAVWLLQHHKQFTGVQSHPVINRLLALNDRWDITGGAFPMSLDDSLVRQHCWVFSPYTDMRKSGELASAREGIRNCIMACGENLTAAFLGQAKEKMLDTRYEILYASDRFKIVDEIGGNEARYHLFAQGMLDNGYISLVARRHDGRFVYTIGRRSQYVDFPMAKLYAALSAAERVFTVFGSSETKTSPWGGSDLIGGSNREFGSGLTWEQIRDIVKKELGA